MSCIYTYMVGPSFNLVLFNNWPETRLTTIYEELNESEKSSLKVKNNLPPDLALNFNLRVEYDDLLLRIKWGIL